VASYEVGNFLKIRGRIKLVLIFYQKNLNLPTSKKPPRHSAEAGSSEVLCFTDANLKEILHKVDFFLTLNIKIKFANLDSFLQICKEPALSKKQGPKKNTLKYASEYCPMKMITHLYPRFIKYGILMPSIFLFVLIACESKVPDDMMFCKSEEVFVLESPFDDKSAIIVMYRGDDIRLIGDTAYQKAITPEMKVDSSFFYVKVKAKRGVVGWVNAKDLQHERPKIHTRKPKESVIIEKIEGPTITVDSSLTSLDTDIVMNDSIWKLWMGSYSFAADTSDNPEIFSIICSRKDSAHIQFEFLRKNAEDCNTSLKGIMALQFNEAVYRKDSCKINIRFTPPYLELEKVGRCAATDIDCNFEYKLKKIKGKVAPDK
jgi:hypothetical protein